MDYLGTMFLILTPFGFFCTENGTGMITGPIFLILGILFKWLAKNGTSFTSTPKAKYQVSSEEFWKIKFKEQYDKLKQDDVSEMLNSINVKHAKRWADDVTRSHGAIPPSDERYEQIAKELGIKTEKAIRTETDRRNRLNIAKTYLLRQYMQDYVDTSLCRDYTRILKDACDFVFILKNGNFNNTYWGSSCSMELLEKEWVKIPESEKNEARTVVNRYVEAFSKTPKIDYAGHLNEKELRKLKEILN